MPQSPRTASSVTHPTGGSHALAGISGPPNAENGGVSITRPTDRNIVIPPLQMYIPARQKASTAVQIL